MKIISSIFIIIFFLLALAIGAQNQAMVNVNYLIAQGEFQLSVLLGGCFAVGFILAWFLIGSIFIQTRFQRNRLKKKVSKQQEEITRLNNLVAAERERTAKAIASRSPTASNAAIVTNN